MCIRDRDEPFAGVTVAGGNGQVGAECVVVNECALDILEVKDHPQVESRKVEYGRAAPHEVVDRIRIAAHLSRENVQHGESPPTQAHLLVRLCPNPFSYSMASCSSRSLPSISAGSPST